MPPVHRLMGKLSNWSRLTSLVQNRHLDLGMLLLLNARERQMREWPVLFHQADPGFRYLGARQPPGDTRWLIEAEWRGAE